MEELNNIITLTDESGNEVEFEFLDLIEFNANEYVVLLPLEEDDDMVVILKVEPDADDPELEQYVAVDSDSELEAVFEIFKLKFADEFNFSE